MGWTMRRGALAKLLLALAILVGGLAGPQVTATAYAQVTTTTVADTVYTANGTPATGTVIVSWPSFSTMTGQLIPGGSESTVIGAGGALSIALVPNVGATPIGSYYTAVYHLGDGSIQREYWVVPVTSSPVTLAAVRNTVLSTSVAIQAVTKSYVDQAIAAAVAGGVAAPQDATGYVRITGDTMTGPLALPGDPVSANQAADKHYVDTSAAGVTGGLGQKVSLNPSTTQVIAQPTGTDLEVNRLSGVEYSSQYVSGSGNNGIANATSSSDCTSATTAGKGCLVQVEPGVSASELYAPQAWANATHVVDQRLGAQRDAFVNPRNPLEVGNEAGETVAVVSTESTQAIHQQTGAQEVQSAGLVIEHAGLAGGSNLFPENLESVPYFKSNFAALSLTGNYNTLGQHVLAPMVTNCYAVGDCLIGSQFVRSSGGFRDSADEGAHPMDLQVSEDGRVFQGACAAGCSTGSQLVTVGSQVNSGTQGEGRFLIDKNPAGVITAGALTGGTTGTFHSTAAFSGSSFPVSTFFSTAALIPSQSGNLAPGTVTFAIATTGVPSGYMTNTTAAPSTTGTACVADQATTTTLQNYEMAPYTVIDGTHLQMTLSKPHGALATIAMGGLCGYGLEQTVDTFNGLRQVFPVIGSFSATGIYYAGALTPIVGINSSTSAFVNASAAIVSAVRSSNVVTLTLAGGFASDVNGLTVTVTGATDPSYNGSFVATTTGKTTLTYAQTGANSSTSGGTAAVLTGGYALYPMAEVVGVYNASTKGVDGQMQLAPNMVAWAVGDAVEEPHYYQIMIGGDIQFITQYLPRPSTYQRAGYEYMGVNGPGLRGFQVANDTPASSYFGNGGTHGYPDTAYLSAGIWNKDFDMQAGETSVFSIHCNSKGCNRWNSGYDLFELDSSAGQDQISYQPVTSTLSLNMRGIPYSFSPLALTAGTVNAGTVNATTLTGAVDGGSVTTGTVAVARLPVMGASGLTHAAGLAPDPGTTAGTSRYLREDGTWVSPAGGVTGFNGRTGAVAPATGDYSFSQLSGSLSTSQISGPTVIAALGYTPSTFAPLTGTGLLGQYQFNESSGTTLIDYSGNGNNGTITNSPTLTGIGYNFSGTSNNVDLPAALNAANTYYFVVNFPPATFGNTNQNNSEFLSSTQTTSAAVEILGYVPPGSAASGNYGILVTDGAGTYLAEAPDFFAGTHIITVVCNVTGSPSLYLDGNLTGLAVSSGSSCNGRQTGGHFRIGTSAHNGALTAFATTVYGAAFYSTVHTAATVQSVVTALRGQALGKGVPFLPTPYSSPNSFYLATGDSITCGQTLTGGTTTCGTGSVASNAYPALVPGSTTNSYTAKNYGVPGAYVQQQISSAPYVYAPFCNTTAGQSVASLMEGTNNFLTAGVTAAQVFALQSSWVNLMKGYGCRTMLFAMLSRTGNAASSVTFDTQKNAMNAALRSGWKTTGAHAFVDFGSDPLLGADGAYANTSNFADGIHPTAAMQVRMAAAVACLINAIDGSSPQAMNQVALMTASATLSCADGGRLLDATANAVNYTLPSAMYMTGRQVRYCNVTHSGTNTATLTAPSDFPFNNTAGSTSVAVAQGACVNLEATFNGSTTAPGNYWRTF